MISQWLAVLVNLKLSTTIRLYGGKLGHPYQVAGVHFHWGRSDSEGSEHTINGQQFPLEVRIKPPYICKWYVNFG